MKKLIKVLTSSLFVVFATNAANATTYTGAGVFTLGAVSGPDCVGCTGEGTSQITRSGSNPSTLTANQKTGTVSSGNSLSAS